VPEKVDVDTRSRHSFEAVGDAAWRRASSPQERMNLWTVHDRTHARMRSGPSGVEECRPRESARRVDTNRDGRHLGPQELAARVDRPFLVHQPAEQSGDHTDAMAPDVEPPAVIEIPVRDTIMVAA